MYVCKIFSFQDMFIKKIFQNYLTFGMDTAMVVFISLKKICLVNKLLIFDLLMCIEVRTEDVYYLLTRVGLGFRFNI